ncbi:MAG: galactose-1-phosphate uridylyltransferase [bacterium]
MPELRRDPIIGRWIIVATERGARPSDFKHSEEKPEDPEQCPFCPGHEDRTPPQITAVNGEGNSWQVRVVPNKYPALSAEGFLNRQGEGMYDRMEGVGLHDVVIETPSHFQLPDEMDEKHMEAILRVYRDRIVELRKDRRIQYVIIFKNHGRAAGASLSHPHSQIIALPMVPIRVRQEMTGAKAYYEYKERCVFCDMIREEQSAGKRIVGENCDFLAVEPYASRFPFETWIIPKNHSGHFEEMREDEISSLAGVLKTVLGKLRRTISNPPFNFMVHTTPIREPQTTYYHWHMEIMPKLSHVAGFEWGTGFYINTVQPEQAAEFLNSGQQ